jgi:hypothetical protein
VRFSGRLHGRPLDPGKYRIAIVVVRGRSRRQIGNVAVEVVRPGRHLTRTERTAPVSAPCAGHASSGPLLPAFGIGSLASPQAFGVAGATANRSSPAQREESGVLRPPHISPPGGFVFQPPGGFGGFAWTIIGIAGALALAVGIPYGLRFVRSSWRLRG